MMRRSQERRRRHATPRDEQESREEEEIDKEPHGSMVDADSQLDELYLYVESRRPEPGPAVEEHASPPLLIAPAPLQPPQPPAELELPEPGEQLRRSARKRHPPDWYGRIAIHSIQTVRTQFHWMGSCVTMTTAERTQNTTSESPTAETEL